VQGHIGCITGSMNIIGAKLKENDADKKKRKEINDELPNTHKIEEKSFKNNMDGTYLFKDNNTPIIEECFQNINQEFENDITPIILITDNINEVENWKGLGEPKKKIKRGN